jgi:hypothetical protein
MAISRKTIDQVLKNYGASIRSILESYAANVDLPVLGAPKKKLFLDTATMIWAHKEVLTI